MKKNKAEFQQYLTEMLPGAYVRINMFGASACLRF